jgi:hypothetical protein
MTTKVHIVNLGAGKVFVSTAAHGAAQSPANGQPLYPTQSVDLYVYAGHQVVITEAAVDNMSAVDEMSFIEPRAPAVLDI